MPSTKFAIVYATESKMIRRIVVPDDDAELVAGSWASSGESVLIVPDGPHDLFTCMALVKEATGVHPADPHCAVVGDSGHVIGFVRADPALDTHPRGKIVSCGNHIRIGDRIDK
jgi:hypothetical protein